MSINPEFNNYSLQTSSIITERVEFRTRAKRKIESEEIARRMGKKMLNEQLQEKVIQISGIILGSSPSDLSDKVDEFHKEVSKVEKRLIIESTRAYTATAEKISIPDRSYSQSYVNFEVQFVVAEGFAEDNQHVATYVLPSGTLTGTITTTISGSVPNRPLFRFLLTSGNAQSGTAGITLTNTDTGNDLTISGVWQDSDEIAIDFDNFKVTQNGSIIDYTGAMDLIEAGSNSFTVTLSGINDGTNISLEYNPRYY